MHVWSLLVGYEGLVGEKGLGFKVCFVGSKK